MNTTIPVAVALAATIAAGQHIGACDPRPNVLPSDAAASPNAAPDSSKRNAPDTANAGTVRSQPEALFVRDQPRVSNIWSWGKNVVVDTNPPTVVNVTQRSASAIEVPGKPKVYTVTKRTPHDQSLVVLIAKDDASGKARTRLYITEQDGARWREYPLPSEAVLADLEAYVLAADSDTVVVLTPDKAHRLEGIGDTASWSSRPVPPRKPRYPGLPKDTLLVGERVYLGYDRGEWGGELVSLDLATGSWREEAADRDEKQEANLPVRDLAVDPKGHLWVVRGLLHGGLREGILSTLDGGSWKRVATAGGNGWSLPETAYDAIAFDTKGRLHLLTSGLGLVRREGPERWKRLTPNWPDHVYVNGLAIVDGTAAIATYDAGVILVELDSGAMHRVVLDKQVH